VDSFFDNRQVSVVVVVVVCKFETQSNILYFDSMLICVFMFVLCLVCSWNEKKAQYSVTSKRETTKNFEIINISINQSKNIEFLFENELNS
jgi:hypothetical protein